MKVEQVVITYKNGSNYEFMGGGYELHVSDDSLQVEGAGMVLFYELIDNIKDFGVTL